MKELLTSRYLIEWMGNPLFLAVDTDAVIRVIRASGQEIRVCSYSPGEIVCSRTSFQRALGFLLKGTVSVLRNVGHGGMRMSELQAGDLFGAAALYTDAEEYVTEIVCRKPSRILYVPEALWTMILMSDSSVMTAYLRYLGGRLRYLNDRLDALSQDSMEDRLMLYLGTKAQDGVYRADRYSHLAEELCVGRATLYRAIDSLCADGRIRKDGNTIYLNDAYKLEEKRT